MGYLTDSSLHALKADTSNTLCVRSSKAVGSSYCFEWSLVVVVVMVNVIGDDRSQIR